MSRIILLRQRYLWKYLRCVNSEEEEKKIYWNLVDFRYHFGFTSVCTQCVWIEWAFIFSVYCINSYYVREFLAAKPTSWSRLNKEWWGKTISINPKIEKKRSCKKNKREKINSQQLFAKCIHFVWCALLLWLRYF